MGDRVPGEHLDLTLTNRFSELARISAALEDFGGRHGLDAGMLYKLNLSIDELFTNIVSYGYNDKLAHAINLEITLVDGVIACELRDDGKPFDPLSRPDPDINLPPEERAAGGLGIFFAKQAMDELAYRRDGNLNIITLKKKIS